MTVSINVMLSIVAIAVVVSTVQSTEESEHKPLTLPHTDSLFQAIRTKNCVYIDKTEYIKDLLQTEYTLVFFARPRRFGKTVLIDTLDSFFQGEKDLFNGLKIKAYGDNEFPSTISSQPRNGTEWLQLPVIRLDFLNMYFNTISQFEERFGAYLQMYAKRYQVD